MIMVDLKTTFSEGDVFSAGSTVDNDKLNGITNEINSIPRVYYKIYSSAAEVTVSDSTWADTVKTFTVTHPANTLLLGFYLEGSIKSSSSGSSARGRIKLVGTTLGTKYIYTILLGSTDFPNGSDALDNQRWYVGTGTSPDNCMLYKNAESYVFQTTHGTLNYLLPDTSTTFTIQLSSNHDNTKTAYIKDVILRVVLANAIEL